MSPQQEASFKRFQSTLPRGSDIIGIKQQPELTLISIHAPSRERLASLLMAVVVVIYFNPRSLAGATLNSSF